MRPSIANKNSQFINANPDWLYQIATRQGVVHFNHQPQQDVWLAHSGKEDFKLLPGSVVVRLLNEALENGLSVAATFEEHTLIWN